MTQAMPKLREMPEQPRGNCETPPAPAGSNIQPAADHRDPTACSSRYPPGIEGKVSASRHSLVELNSETQGHTIQRDPKLRVLK